MSSQSKDSPRTGQVFKMMDQDGNERLWHIVEHEEPESEHSEDRNLPSDEQILAQYEQHSESSDSGRESDIDRPLSPYGGSQYTSDDPDERVGFMRDSGPSDSESECEEYTLSN
ncbi:hypothetical protein V5O48_015914, partial [Marasmius crinis-equi]